jgi:anti-sigma regulatory factor (Ser/Thr protein kinase)
LDEQVVDSLLLVVSEMVTNAVEHSSGPVRLRVSTGRRHVTVAVSDSGSGSPWQGHVTDSSVRGRGLVIVDALCDSWGVERRPGGKTVWARVARTAEAR